MNRPVTRATFLSGLFGLGAIAVAPDAYATCNTSAARNADAEQFVQRSASEALTALGNPNAVQREQQFRTLMTQFADTRRIGLFVLGRYRGALEADSALRNEWLTTFQEFAIATYQSQFSSFNGARIEVMCSEEQTATTVIVDSTIRPRGGDPVRVQWKVLRSQNVWKATDVAVGTDGVWLSQLQQRLFMRQLDTQFNGDLRQLLADVRQRTTTLRSTTVARS
ncbi:MAG: ABC transporter substrate-binding protein [Hyphomonadaceae bacterium]|nr:ABC transporter substrate-binding protein [Hyphomonadaceae bacterium]MCA8885295.1 ABC transporter substrate-binding protein [Hyphomonadaceae bacterium]